MKLLITLFAALFFTGCASNDLLRTAEVAAIVVDGKQKVQSAVAAVQVDKGIYSESDYSKLESNYTSLLAIYSSFQSLSDSSTRKQALVNIVARMPEVRVHVRSIHEVIKLNIESNSPESRAVLNSLLFDLEVLNENYNHVLAQGNAQTIRDNAALYIRALAPILLTAAKQL